MIPTHDPETGKTNFVYGAGDEGGNYQLTSTPPSPTCDVYVAAERYVELQNQSIELGRTLINVRAELAKVQSELLTARTAAARAAKQARGQ